MTPPEPELVLGPPPGRRRGIALGTTALVAGALAALAMGAAGPPSAPVHPPTVASAGADGAPTAVPLPGSAESDSVGGDSVEAVTAEAPFDLLERVRGDELDGFHAALAATAAKRDGAITRVTHLGDSSIGLDQLTHAVRKRFQDRFGDAGPGFVLLQPHSGSYRHAQLSPIVKTEWELCFLIFRCRSDGHYGLGGVTVWSRGGAETAYRVPSTEGARSRFEVWYAAQPGGGALAVDTGESRRVLRTDSPRLEDARFVQRLPVGTHRVRVQAVGGGLVRGYGVVLEHERPGVVWDGLSMIGAFTHRLLAQDASHLATQIAWRSPDLVVLSYGGNDLRRVASGHVSTETFREETRDVIRHVRRGKPGVACIVVGINDHRKSGKLSIVPEQVEAVSMAQRLAARDAGCAFFDTYRAMGGHGAFERWRDHRPPLVAQDRKHLTQAGRRLVARRLYDALLRDHERWRERRFAEPG